MKKLTLLIIGFLLVSIVIAEVLSNRPDITADLTKEQKDIMESICGGREHTTTNCYYRNNEYFCDVTIGNNSKEKCVFKNRMIVKDFDNTKGEWDIDDFVDKDVKQIIDARTIKRVISRPDDKGLENKTKNWDTGKIE